MAGAPQSSSDHTHSLKFSLASLLSQRSVPQSQGMVPPVVHPLAVTSIMTTPGDVPKNQPSVNSHSLGFLPQVTLGYVKLTELTITNDTRVFINKWLFVSSFWREQIFFLFLLFFFMFLFVCFIYLFFLRQGFSV